MRVEMIPRLALYAFACLILSGIHGCIGEAEFEGIDGDYDRPYERTPISVNFPNLNGPARSCDRSDYEPHGLACYEKDDFRWRTSCQSESCRDVQVYVHYMLPEDLGDVHVVHVEAFNNSYFQGAPAGTVQLSGFRAVRGHWQQAALYLSPGEYYLRAYLTNGEERVVPYPLGGSVLVEEKPVGVYGVLSRAEMLRVAPQSQMQHQPPVHIYLDKLFRRPQTEPETKAHLRVTFTANHLEVADRRKLIIQLHESSDLSRRPVREFTMATELLLVQGRPGRAEYVTPSLPEGQYVVFAFIDADENGYFDQGELSDLYKVDGQAYAVKIKKDRTESVSLSLSKPVSNPG